MKKNKILLTASVIVLLSLSISKEVFASTEDKLSATVGIDFFNRFQQEGTGFATDAFQRYHTLAVKYAQNPWSVQVTYNWLDLVASENSIHTLTIWGFDLHYQISEKQTLILNYWWDYDVLTRDIDSHALRLDLAPAFPISNSWTSEGRYGLQWDGQQLQYDVGVKLTFHKIYNLSINYLNPDDALVLEKGAAGIPVSVGVSFKFNRYNSLEIAFYSNLVPMANGINQWVKTSLLFKI